MRRSNREAAVSPRYILSNAIKRRHVDASLTEFGGTRGGRGHGARGSRGHMGEKQMAQVVWGR